jgi:HAD superfamily hydrolase (TIGR01509 family)
MKQCVIFDMDGVIIDSEPMHKVCEREMFKRFGLSVSEEDHNALVGATDETMWQRIANIYGLPVTVTKAIQLTKTLYMDYLKDQEHLTPIPYVSKLIAELYRNEFSLILASSSPHDQIDYILENFRIRPYFHTTISGEDVKAGKPDPEIFVKAAQLAGVDSKDCVVIEDSHNGVTAAKRANMKCIGFLNPNSGNQDLSKADKIVHSLGEVSVKTIIDLL